jgi:hypothetical protein
MFMIIAKQIYEEDEGASSWREKEEKMQRKKRKSRVVVGALQKMQENKIQTLSAVQ